MPARISVATAKRLGIPPKSRHSSESVLAAIRAVPDAKGPPSKVGPKTPSVPLTMAAAANCCFVVGVETKHQGGCSNNRWTLYNRHKKQRKAALEAAAVWVHETGWKKSGRVVVHLCRVSGGKLDGDGLRTATKYVRDGVASALGFTNDRESAALDWRYSQRVQRGVYGVEVVVTSE